jgi:Carbohydrate esterase, sialic acid-specific acetylesterase
MKLHPIKRLTTVVMTALLFSTNVGAAEKSSSNKKLLVYILAGQSNMQGHAEVSTLAYLPKPAHIPTKEEWSMLTTHIDREIRLKMEPTLREKLLKDPAMAKLSRNEFAEVLQKALKEEAEKARSERYEVFKQRQTNPARVARDKELAKFFTPNLTDPQALDALNASKSLKGTSLDVANLLAEKTAIPQGKRTYIAAYGGVNRGMEPGIATGPLSTGYGARPSAFGPEYAFGILMEKSLDQPILIIKTAWGGKSLHYDFRPPSAGAYQPTEQQKKQLEDWKTRKATWDKYLAGGGTAAAMMKIDKTIKSIENEKRSLQASLAKLPKDQQAETQQEITTINTQSADLRKQYVRPPGEMPNHDAASFYWNEMIGFVRKVLADPKAYHPEYDATSGFEVAGGVWFQGFNDQFDPEYYGNYSKNMVHFIKDLRTEVKQPKMPFIIGVLGTPAFPEEAMTNNVANGHREAAKSLELAGTVAAVESWPLTTPEVAIWRMKRDAANATGDKAAAQLAEQQWLLHGSNLGYHYDGSGRFFIRLGDEFASAMLKLMGE